MGANIKTLRDTNTWSLRDFAQRSGVSVKVLRRMEAGAIVSSHRTPKMVIIALRKVGVREPWNATHRNEYFPEIWA